MAGWNHGVYRALASSFLLLAVTNCGDKSSNGGNGSLSDPDVFEAKARASFKPIIVGINDGLSRLLAALAGGPADGVVITPFQGGTNAVIAVDWDGNGSREGSINGGLVGDVSTGALVTINSITGDDPTLIGGGNLTATETSPGVIVLDNISGNGEKDPPGEGNIAEVAVAEGAVSIDAAAGVPSGFVDIEVTGENESLDVSITFTPDGQGGFRIHFTGPGIDFTIP